MQSSTKRTLWGLLAFSPSILCFVFAPFALRKSVEMHAFNGTTDLNTLDIAFLGIGNLYVLVVLICFLIYLNRLPNVGNDKKWFWRTLMLFGHVVAFAVFWYFYIWKGNK